MSYRVFAAKCRYCCVLALAVACAIVVMSPASTRGQVIQSAVGGVSIDADGIVNNATIDNMNKLGDQRRQELGKVPGDLNGATEMRRISLRRLEAAIDECAEQQTAARRYQVPRRFAAHSLRLRLSRAERHRVGRAGRGMEG